MVGSRTLTVLAVVASMGGCASARAIDCREVPVGVQVLGSGGPIPDDGRASSGYLVWVDGEARVLVDAGGGTFLRLAESGASIDDLEVIALSHLHADHAAELPALLKGSFFGARQADLPIVGPRGSESFPGLPAFLDALFGPAGAFRYLGWLLEPGKGRFSLRPMEVGPDQPTPVVDVDGLRLVAVGVEHGPVPALGFRVDVGEASVAFGGDQNADSSAFEALAEGVDVLVVHHAIGDERDAVAHRLHRSPAELAALGRATRPHTIVLSHNMARALARVDQTQREIAEASGAEVVVAEDLQCVPVPGR